MSLRSVLISRITLLVAVLALLALACDDDPPAGTDNVGFEPVRIAMETSMGDVTLELLHEESPVTVENFQRYVNERFYDGLVFHRVISSFMNQGGSYDADLELRDPTHPPIPNESANGVSNVRGTVSMVRFADPHSGTSGFFINVVDNPFLDHVDDANFGYCVFARVVDGMDVVDAINAVPTHAAGGMGDVPVTPVTIHRARRLPMQ